MDRRKFVQGSLASLAGVYELFVRLRHSMASAFTRARNVNLPGVDEPAGQGSQRLFPIDVPSKDWTQFRAEGFSHPACGFIYRSKDRVFHGAPLGGISTGFLDVDTNGLFGNCTIFNSGVPIRGPLDAPFLGFNIEGRTWLLTTRDLEQMVIMENAKEIHYWGHYPVVDIEYETRAPISVGLRAWTPFIPGDVWSSSIPAAIFEVHLRNPSAFTQKGTLAFSFPGPTQAEAQISPESPREHKFVGGFPVNVPAAAGLIPAKREETLVGGFRGVSVSSAAGTGYALGVISKEGRPRFGSSLWVPGYEYASGQHWAAIGKRLPPATETDFSSSVALDFALDPGRTETVRILLAWYSPIWKGEGTHWFSRMYTARYKDAVAVAEAVARDHEALLKRVLAWQQAVYASDDFPIWLRESLVNILHLIPRTSYWAVAQPPIGDWCRPEDGLFGMNECPRECPQIECIPCSFYGNIPLPYFFPELALSTLRGYKAYQYPDGATPWVFGGCTSGAADGYRATDGTEMAIPSPGYQTTLNGACYVSMLDRYWQRTGNDEVVKEFYPSVKKNTIYTMNLRSGPDGIVSVPEGNVNPTQPKGQPGRGLDWFEGNGWFGMTPHVGGIHLAQIRMVQRMAEKVGDKAFAEECRQWLKQGSDSMENKLWTGQYYLSYYEPESGKKSDLVFGYQLDGDWMCFYHGLPPVFRPDRAKIALETIKRTCMRLSRYGAVNFANADGTVVRSEEFMLPGWGLDYGSYGYFAPEVYMLAATFMYQGQREIGIELAKKCVHGLLRKGYTWTFPCLVDGRTSTKIFGADYYQNLMLWALPAAIQGINLAEASDPGGLVDRMIQAAKTA